HTRDQLSILVLKVGQLHAGCLLERRRLRGAIGLASPRPRRDGVLTGVGDLQVLVETRTRLVVVVVAVRVDLLQPIHQVRGAAVAQHVLSRSPAPRGTTRVHREPPELVRDRKSTRLNSSHVKISYAVLCLK